MTSMDDFVEFEKILERGKNEVKILILGSYEKLCPQGMTESCEVILEGLRQFLKTKGFLNTKLVKDWVIEKDIPSETLVALFREKSFYYIDNWAEILVFVFLNKANNSSVTREFSHMVDSTKQKCKHSIILRQNGVNLGTLIKGDILVERVLESSFNDKKELHESAFAGCFNILFALEREKHS